MKQKQIRLWLDGLMYPDDITALHKAQAAGLYLILNRKIPTVKEVRDV